MKSNGERPSNLSHNPRAPGHSRAQTLLMVSPQRTIPLATPFASRPRRGILGRPRASLRAAHLLTRAAPAGVHASSVTRSLSTKRVFTARRGPLSNRVPSPHLTDGQTTAWGSPALDPQLSLAHRDRWLSAMTWLPSRLGFQPSLGMSLLCDTLSE